MICTVTVLLMASAIVFSFVIFHDRTHYLSHKINF